MLILSQPSMQFPMEKYKAWCIPKNTGTAPDRFLWFKGLQVFRMGGLKDTLRSHIMRDDHKNKCVWLSCCFSNGKCCK